MKRTAAIILFCGLLFFAYQCDNGPKSSGPANLKSNKDSISYVIGVDISRSLEMFKEELDLDILEKGLRDGLAGNDSLITREQATPMMREFSKRMREKQMEKDKATEAKNTEEGKKFLAENGKKPGVVTTPSGLQYTVLKEGTGPKPSMTDKVKVHYKGTLIDGTEFDSSYKRGQPTEFPVGGVIKGWSEAMLLMNVGSKYKLFVPSDLAYGKRGAPGGKIGPNATLVFEVELLEIVK